MSESLNTKQLYILYGSSSPEREVSLKSKDYFYQLYKEQNPILIEWTVDHLFIINNKTYTEKEFLSLLPTNALIILATHGTYGEDGYIQEKLTLHNIEYTGSDAASCALSFNKYESNNRVNSIINTIPTYKCYPQNFDYEICKKYIGDTFPIFAKPNKSGASIDTYKICSSSELNTILQTLPDTEFLFQPAIKGTEVSIGCIRDDNSFLDIPITEIIPNADFFDYHAKFDVGGSVEITPARISQEITNHIKYLSCKIHNALGLGYYSRTDMIITPEQEIYYLETNTLPGMSPTSLLPQQLKEANLVEKFKEGLITHTIKPIN